MTDSFITVYSTENGKKRRVPPHWLTVFPGKFKKTPLTKRQEAKAAERADNADAVAEAAQADADARMRANRAGVPTTATVDTMPAVIDDEDDDTQGDDAPPTDPPTDGEGNTNTPTTGTNEGEVS